MEGIVDPRLKSEDENLASFSNAVLQKSERETA